MYSIEISIQKLYFTIEISGLMSIARGREIKMRINEKIDVKKFDGSDFIFWKMQIEDYPYDKDLYQPLKSKPEKMEQEEWELLDRKAMSVIRLSLSRDVAYHTITSRSTKEVMKTLEEMYQKPSITNKVHLIRRLFDLRMLERTPVQQYLNEFNMINVQLNMVNVKFDDKIRALILLSSLPDSWVRAMAGVSAKESKLTFDKVRDLMIDEEICRRESRSFVSRPTINTVQIGRSKRVGYGKGKKVKIQKERDQSK